MLLIITEHCFNNPSIRKNKHLKIAVMHLQWKRKRKAGSSINKCLKIKTENGTAENDWPTMEIEIREQCINTWFFPEILLIFIDQNLKEC